jgi:hypothetical protein
MIAAAGGEVRRVRRLYLHDQMILRDVLPDEK